VELKKYAHFGEGVMADPSILHSNAAHAAIRANPEHVKVEPKKPEVQKRWNKKALTLVQRKHNIGNKKA
jgi:hypothetical protein